MSNPDDRTRSEYDLLAANFDRWQVVDAVVRRTGVNEDDVKKVLEALQNPKVAEEVVRNAQGVEEHLLTLDIRVRNASVRFAQRAVEVLGQVRPAEDKGVNYTSHWEDAIEAAQNEIESKFK